MTGPFPHKSVVRAEATPGINVQWSAQKEKLEPLPCTIPPEFGGAPSGITPEDFFAWAALNCIIGLFKVYCEKKKIEFKTLRGEGIAILDLDTTRNLSWITQLELFFVIEGAQDKEQIKATLEEAIKNCPVSNSIKSGKTYHIEVI